MTGDDVLVVRNTRPGRIRRFFVLLLIVAVAVGAVTYLFRAPNRDSAGTLVAALAAVATVLGPGTVWLWRQMRQIEGVNLLLNGAANELAEEVRQQWEQAATQRGLMPTSPIAVRWQWSRRGITGPIAAAAGGGRFPPLPGMAAIMAKNLHSGTIKDLFKIYGGLSSGRLLILGRPGAGKSGAAIGLLLDALSHRTTCNSTTKQARHQVRVPVPVLFTLHGWDPCREPVVNWLASRLTADYALLRAPAYGGDTAARLIRSGYIAVILDGLDEMPQALRSKALRALDKQATFRLVVLTRSQEMVEAADGVHLQGAAALELLPIDSRQAAGYLASCQINPLPVRWQQLIDHLAAHPDSAVAQALQTPLMVTLVRDTYRTDDPVDELIDSERFPSREAIENHLLDRVLPAAYAPRLGHATSSYRLDQARRWLGHLARRMNAEQTRDLAWWQIPHWAPAWPRALATILACELVVGLIVGPVAALVVNSGFKIELASKLGFALTFGLIIGFMGAFGERPPRYLSWLRRSETDSRRNLMTGLACGLVFGLLGGIVNGIANGFVHGIVYGLIAGLLSGSIVGSVGTFGERPPLHLSWPQWKRTDISMNLVFALLFGSVAGLAYGIVGMNGFGPIGKGVGHGFWNGFVLLAVVWLVFVLVFTLGRPSEKATSPIDPRSSWRHNQQFGLVIGLLAALAYGIVQSFVVESASWTFVWVVSGIAMGSANGLVFPATWQVTLANAQLWGRGEAPANFLRFLEDARERQILRTVGQVYQFRHGQLQDRLASTLQDQDVQKNLLR